MPSHEHVHEEQTRVLQGGKRASVAYFMFIGGDHGTTAIIIATPERSCGDLARQEASRLSEEEIVDRITQHLGNDRVDLVALSYSMGDGLTRIVRLEDAPKRGLVQLDGAGLHILKAKRSSL
jgi:hypothetical protein